METTTSKELSLYQLVPEKPGHGIKENTFSKGRVLIGRTESCEFVIPSDIVSAVHAILEITPNSAKIYDMNSKNGTFVNGKRVVAEAIKVGDKISFGNVVFNFVEYQKAPELPPVLDVLEPQQGEASIKKYSTSLPAAPVSLPEAPESITQEEEQAPYIVYPLASDPNSDYSEYIFEDVEELVPIFKYDHGKQAVEVIILFNDKVYSVDYLNEKDGVYHIVGANPKKSDLEFAYLGKNDRLPFVELKSGNCVVNSLPGYKAQHLTDNDLHEVNDSRINIQGDDVLRLENGHLEVYVRRVSAPPHVKPAPFFRRDQGLRKYLLLIFLLTFLPLIALNIYKVDKELDKEKDPERIARILYKQPLKVSKTKAVEKTKKKPPKKQKTKVKKQTKPKKPKKPTPKVAQKPKPKKVVKKVTKNPGVKTAKKVQTVKKVKNPAPKSPAPKIKSTSSASASKIRKTTQTRKSLTPRKTQGPVDVFKSFSFKSTVNNNMAKGGTLKGAVAKSASSTNIGSATVSGGVATNVKTATTNTSIGSLTGATVGKLAQSKGAEGLSSKRGIMTAGIPSETVVLGSMDPDVIRRILREHIPQFRYCYQKELDRNAGRDISGTIGLIFTIGASGHVSKAGVASGSGLPGDVRGCVVRVLRGIKFPRPMGGGTVDVKQPFNFMPKRL